MFAVLNRGGMRQIRLPKTSNAAQAAPHAQPISAAEARKLLLAGAGWEDMRVNGALDLAGSTIAWLPDGLHCTSLSLANCHSLTALPERLETRFLDISGCPHLTTLPESTVVHSGLELANSGLQGLPPGMRVRLLWEGIAVDERTAFYPETLSGQDVLRQDNLELRRVLLERIGYDRLMQEVGGLILDRDQDAGGERKLIRIPLDDDEDIYLVSLICPSTAHQYVLRVPPFMHSCRQAVAWIAGFNIERDYEPILEA
jgi:hypothetical protein